MELIQRLEAVHPHLTGKLYLVSCEEAVEDVGPYVTDAPRPELAADSLEKEHVMVAMRLHVAGRSGVLLCDPGYHVARVVTVMHDGCYPHTGWFSQSEEDHLKRDYSYSFSAHSSHYVEWAERETRGAKVKHTISLVYVQRPYLTAADVTVRRNLVYNFRSLLARDTKGQVVAGLYFPLRRGADPEVTLFFESASVKHKVKHRFSTFLQRDKMSVSVTQQLEQCSAQLRMSLQELADLLKSLAGAVSDQEFIHQVLHINGTITEMSADN